MAEQGKSHGSAVCRAAKGITESPLSYVSVTVGGLPVMRQGELLVMHSSSRSVLEAALLCQRRESKIH